MLEFVNWPTGDHHFVRHDAMLTSAKRHFVQLWWSIIHGLATRTRTATVLLTGFISLLIFLWAETAEPKVYFGVAKSAWQNVSGGVMAAALFYFVQWLVDLAREAEVKTYEQWYKENAGERGLRTVYQQRGSLEVRQAYTDLIDKATRRVWAFGMTNRHFINQHAERLATLVASHPVDVVVAFWDPSITLRYPGPPVLERSILEVQGSLEGMGGTDWVTMVENSKATLLNGIQGNAALVGTLRLFHFASVAAFSCLIVDNSVFFFPFLAEPESNNDPIILCAADSGIGKAVVKHFTVLLSTPAIARQVYPVQLQGAGP